MGRVLIDLQRFDRADNYLKKSYPQNLKRVGGFALADLVALAEAAYRQQDYEKVEEWVNETRIPWKREILLGSQRADSELFYGRLLRFLAESQLGQERYDDALLTYVEGLRYIAKHGGYGAYRLDRELDRLRNHIAQLPANTKSQWCQRFIEVWESDDFSSKYSEVVATVRLAQIM
jgi:hypothetical protein